MSWLLRSVGNAYGWTNVSQSAFYAKEQDVYLGLLNRLRAAGARNFLLLTVPPVDRSPLAVSSGAKAAALEKKALKIFNDGLQGMAGKLRSKVGGDGWVGVFDVSQVLVFPSRRTSSRSGHLPDCPCLQRSLPLSISRPRLCSLISLRFPPPDHPGQRRRLRLHEHRAPLIHSSLPSVPSRSSQLT